jgi:hypothetical protein
MTLHRIIKFFTGWFSVCLNINSKHRTIAIFKSSVKEKDPNKPWTIGLSIIFDCTKLHLS